MSAGPQASRVFDPNSWSAEERQECNDLLGVLRRLASLFNEATEDAQEAAHMELGRWVVHKNLGLYLGFVLLRCENEPALVRKAAAVVLKTYNADKMNSSVWQALVENIPTMLSYPTTVITDLFPSIVCNLARRNKCSGFADVISIIFHHLSHPNTDIVANSVATLSKLCEDTAQYMNKEQIQTLVSKVVELLGNPHDEVRYYSLECLAALWSESAEKEPVNMASFIPNILRYFSDPVPKIRAKAHRLVVVLTERKFACLLPLLDDIVRLMLASLQDTDESIAMEACEFWPVIIEWQPNILRSNLPTLVPLLLSRMLYKGDEAALMEEDMEDKKQSRGHGRQMDAEFCVDDSATGWSLRKGAALSLDSLAVSFQGDILPYALPRIAQMINITTAEWQMVEAGILGIGAIASGCGRNLLPNYKDISCLLLQSLTHKHPSIRKISCWSLSRIYDLVLENAEAEGPEKHFKLVLEALLRTCRDPVPLVQISCFCSLAILFEDSNLKEEFLKPFLETIIEVLHESILSSQDTVIPHFCDAIGTLADRINLPTSVGTAFVRPLMEKLRAVPAEPMKAYILDCLTSLTVSLKDLSQDFAFPLFNSCCALLDAKKTNRRFFEEEELAASSLDYILSVLETFPSSVQLLCSNTHILDVLRLHYFQNVPSLVQSVLAIFGTVARSAFPILLPFVSELIPLVMRCYSLEHLPVTANLFWCMAEIAAKFQAGMRPFIPLILPPAIEALGNTTRKINKITGENVVVCLCHMGLYIPEIGLQLTSYLPKICLCLQISKEDESELGSNVLGLLNMVNTNPQILNTSSICEFLGLAVIPLPAQSRDAFQTTLQTLKANHFTQQWNSVIASLPPIVQRSLSTLYVGLVP
ncbi:hypothetical protein Pelo_4039 [Pelomyxa schiedti]|nr:hypothetical protein Pelo_4039 [Pelomyxa schiedti]